MQICFSMKLQNLMYYSISSTKFPSFHVPFSLEFLYQVTFICWLLHYSCKKTSKRNFRCTAPILVPDFPHFWYVFYEFLLLNVGNITVAKKFIKGNVRNTTYFIIVCMSYNAHVFGYRLNARFLVKGKIMFLGISCYMFCVLKAHDISKGLPLPCPTVTFLYIFTYTV